jgi:hydrogenase large subunit
MEQAIQDETIRDTDNPFEVVRTIRSFDPCLACSVHVARRKGAWEATLPL